jgi:hypothetical protein
MIEEKTVFKGKTLSDLFGEIYDNSRRKDRQIEQIVQELKKVIKNPREAVMIHPLIKDYLDVAVKNDEHLLKMATIVQRIYLSEMKGKDDGGGLLTNEEKEALLKNAQEDILKEVNQFVEDANNIVDINPSKVIDEALKKLDNMSQDDDSK